ncbi:MAG: PadR family transcriptional regulator [Gemmatimonadetes bacterium]|nr:PadR family transcriptional regulator [Gemmatimonadota bacterium]
MRGAGPLAVLKLLEAREMYGYELAEALDRQSDGVLALGHSSLYPLLYNLESKGLISQRATRVAQGRSRKYYGLTDRGREWLADHEAQWAGLVEAMSKLGLS